MDADKDEPRGRVSSDYIIETKPLLEKTAAIGEDLFKFSVDDETLESISTTQNSANTNTGLEDSSQTENDEDFLNVVLESVKNKSNLYSIDSIDAKGKAAIHYAAQSGNFCALQELLMAGADVNIQDSLGDTALHILLKIWDPDKPILRKCLTTILKHDGRCINIPNLSGCTPIYIAASQIDRDVVQYLLERCPEIDLDTFKSTEENRTARQVLISDCPDFPLPNVWEPPPSKSVSDYKYRLFYFLVTGQETSFCEVFNDAMSSKVPDCEQLLHCLDSHFFTYLQHACSLGYKRAVKTLLSHGVNINQVHENTKVPALLASLNGHSDVLSLLLNSEKTKIDLSPNRKKQNLLHLLVKLSEPDSGRCKCLRILNSHPGIDVNAKDRKGRTPVYLAIKYNKKHYAFELIDCGAQLDVVNKFGQSPLGIISPAMFRNYLDSKITANSRSATDKSYEIIFDYQIAATKNNCDKHLHGISTELLLTLSKSSSHRDLLTHPIYATIIYFKWERIRAYFYMYLFFYSVFSIFFTLYVYFGDDIQTMDGTCIYNSTDTPNFSLNTNYTTHPYKEYYRSFITNFLLLFIGMIGVGEICQFIKNPHRYFLSFENYVQLAAIIFTASSILSKCIENRDGNCLCPQLNATAILFVWFEFFFVIGSHPKMSFFIDMFRTASIFLFQFFVIHTTLILAFSFSFYELFKHNEGPFSNIGTSIFQTLVMVTGEFNVDSVPLNSPSSYIIFSSFIFLITIVLFNLLIGLAVSATKPIEDDAFLFRCIAEINIISNFEDFLFNTQFTPKRILKILHKRFPRKKKNIDTAQKFPRLLIAPNKKNKISVVFVDHNLENPTNPNYRGDRVLLSFQLSDNIVTVAKQILNKREDALKDKCDKFDDLRNDLEGRQKHLDEELRTIKSALAQIMEKMEASCPVPGAEGPGHKSRRSRSEAWYRKIKIKLDR